jgi:hypothetical protein
VTQPWPSDGLHLDVLPATPTRRPGRLRTVALAGVAAAAAVAVAGTAWATASFLSGGGAQPEDVLPAGVVALAKVDLDPPAGQKLAVYRLAQRFPATADRVSGPDRLKDELLRGLFAEVGDVDYERDIASWVGDRAAIAAVPVASGEPEPLAAVAFTDRDEAEAALTRLAADSADSHWAFSENADYVLLGTSRETVDAAARTDDVLADARAYTDAVDELDGDRVVTAWADLSAVWRAMPEDQRALAGQDGVELAGRMVLGVRATSDAIEVEGRGLGVALGARGTAGIGDRAGLDLLGAVPADAVGALGVTGLGDGLAQLWDRVQGSGDPLGLQATAEAAGLELPEDLRVVFGDQTVAAVFAEEDVAVRSRTDDPERARSVVEAVVGLLASGLVPGGGQEPVVPEGFDEQDWVERFDEEGWSEYPLEPEPFGEPGMGDDGYGEGADPYEGMPLTDGSIGFRGQELPAGQLRVLDDGIVVGSSAAAVDRLAGDDGGLLRSPLFRKAVPDASDAGFVLFLDVQRAVALAGGPGALGEDDGNLQPLEALGISARGGEDGAFRLRLTVR